jgi:predicted O-methyltransferase YrrM
MSRSARRPPTVLSQFLRDQQAKLDQRLGRATLPWMKSRELDIIVEALERLNPARCLEWGAGHSTVYFPPHIPALSAWIAIEHNTDWFAQVRSMPTDTRVTLVAIPPDHGEYPNTRKEGNYEDFHTYVDYPATLGGQFDFVFIDGRARAACLAAAYELVSAEGLVILHDANRDYYVEGLPPYAHTLRLTDYRRGRGGILLAARGRPIETFIDVEAHQRLWRGHDRLAWWLRMR